MMELTRKSLRLEYLGGIGERVKLLHSAKCNITQDNLNVNPHAKLLDRLWC